MDHNQTSFILMILVILTGCIHSKVALDPTESHNIAALEKGFQWLFNGRNLDGWYVVVDEKGVEKDLFTVENGLLHAYENQEHHSTQSYAGIITKKNYSSFDLRLEYKWGEKKFQPRHEFVRDAGIIFHMYGEDKIWPDGVECQIQEGDTGDIWVIGTQVTSKVQKVIRNYSPEGNLETRGGNGQRFYRFHRAYCWEVPEWNTVELEVRGDYAKFSLNGKVVNEAIDMKYWDAAAGEWRPLTAGKILLQAEGAEIYYRNIQIREIR